MHRTSAASAVRAARIAGTALRTVLGLAVFVGTLPAVLWVGGLAAHLGSAMRWEGDYRADVTWSTVGYMGSCMALPALGALAGRLRTPSGRWLVPTAGVVGSAIVAWLLLGLSGLIAAYFPFEVDYLTRAAPADRVAILLTFVGPFMPVILAAVTGTLVTAWRHSGRQVRRTLRCARNRGAALQPHTGAVPETRPSATLDA